MSRKWSRCHNGDAIFSLSWNEVKGLGQTERQNLQDPKTEAGHCKTSKLPPHDDRIGNR